MARLLGLSFPFKYFFRTKFMVCPLLLRKLKRLFLIIFISIFLLSCTTESQWSRLIDWKDFDLNNLPGSENYPNAGAVMLLDEGKIEIFGSGSQEGFSIFEQHRIYKILNHRGHKYANILIAYTPETQIEEIKARTISPDGKITELKKENIYDITLYPNFVFYSDQRAKIFTMPAVEDGTVIEYKYRLRIESWTLRHFWAFQSEIPTVISRFALVKPSDLDINYHVYGIEIEPKVQEAPKGFKSTYVWETRHVPPIEKEFGMPPMKEIAAHIAFSPVGMNTWEDVAKWYKQLAHPQMKAGESVKQLALKITTGAKDDMDKLRKIYEWVRDKVRYIAVEIGIGGFQPYPAEQVLQNRYGDCKDMSTLICSLAREVGLDVREVLISTWQNGYPDTSLPSPFQFNHAIAYCPTLGDSGIWMDATDKNCPFGDLPWYDQGLPALVVDENGRGEIRFTPRTPLDRNRLIIDWNVQLSSNGSAKIKGSSRWWGAIAVEMRNNFYNASTNEKREWLESYLAKKCSGAVLDSFAIRGMFPVEDPFEISYIFHTNTFALKREKEIIIQPGKILSLELPDIFRSPYRKYPIRWRYGLIKKLSLSVSLPVNIVAQDNLYRDSVHSDYGTAKWKWQVEKNTLLYTSQYRLPGKHIEPEQYQKFQKYLEEVRKMDLQEIVIHFEKKAL